MWKFSSFYTFVNHIVNKLIENYYENIYFWLQK